MTLKEKLQELCNNKDFLEKLSNLFSLRELGNKFHGDSLEFALTEWINKYTDIKAYHVGKSFFRSGLNADILISNDKSNIDSYLDVISDLKLLEEYKTNELKKICIDNGIKYVRKKDSIVELKKIYFNKLKEVEKNVDFLSLKNYGKGPLQLLTDSVKTDSLIDRCKSYLSKEKISLEQDIDLSLIKNEEFLRYKEHKIFCCIYDEKTYTFDIIFFLMEDLFNKVKSIKYFPKQNDEDKKLKYEKFIFYDINLNYLFEVRYGKKDANALQRGLWTKTDNNQNDFDYFVRNYKYKINEYYLNSVIKVISGC